MAGKLYIVPTPVGNLEDMTMRGIRILREADLVLAEDTRTSGILLKHFDIHTPMQSHHKYNEHKNITDICEKIESGMNIALVSDAGTPGISDPGFLLSRECRKHEIEVECLPGATAFVPALVSSGLPCDRFVFEGFLPQKKGRATRLNLLANDSRTFVIYESPMRLERTLRQLIEYCGENRQAAVCREISKLHEHVNRASLAELLLFYTQNKPKGEIVIVVEGCNEKSETSSRENEQSDE